MDFTGKPEHRKIFLIRKSFVVAKVPDCMTMINSFCSTQWFERIFLCIISIEYY
jgi:hypothetical protein